MKQIISIIQIVFHKCVMQTHYHLQLRHDLMELLLISYLHNFWSAISVSVSPYVSFLSSVWFWLVSINSDLPWGFFFSFSLSLMLVLLEFHYKCIKWPNQWNRCIFTALTPFSSVLLLSQNSSLITSCFHITLRSSYNILAFKFLLSAYASLLYRNKLLIKFYFHLGCCCFRV